MHNITRVKIYSRMVELPSKVNNIIDKFGITNKLCIRDLNLKAVVSPRSEFHDTGLLVEWKILDVDFAGRLVDSRWFPIHSACVIQRCLCGKGHLKVTISAEISLSL